MPRDSRVNAREEKGGGGQVELDSEGRERERENCERRESMNADIPQDRVLTRCFTNFAPPSINVFILSFRRVPFPRNRCTFRGRKIAKRESVRWIRPSPSLPRTSALIYSCEGSGKRKGERERMKLHLNPRATYT